MAATDLARLTRRVDKHDEDLRVLSDTVLEIREIVAGHSEVLDRHSEVLDRHSKVLDRHTQMLTEILQRLEPAG